MVTDTICTASVRMAAAIDIKAIVTEQGNNTGERPGRVIREFARS